MLKGRAGRFCAFFTFWPQEGSQLPSSVLGLGGEMAAWHRERTFTSLLSCLGNVPMCERPKTKLLTWCLLLQEHDIVGIHIKVNTVISSQFITQKDL